MCFTAGRQLRPTNTILTQHRKQTKVRIFSKRTFSYSNQLPLSGDTINGCLLFLCGRNRLSYLLTIEAIGHKDMGVSNTFDGNGCFLIQGHGCFKHIRWEWMFSNTRTWVFQTHSMGMDVF